MNKLKKWTIGIVAAAVSIAGLGISAQPAAANVWWTTNNCAHATITKAICYDKSAQSVTIVHGPNGPEEGFKVIGDNLGNITKGWSAFDTYECNADANNVTHHGTIPSNTYGFPADVFYTDSTFPVPGAIKVTPAQKATIAWYANSQSGYACFVVP